MAHLPMKDVVYQSEWGHPRIGVPSNKAHSHLTSQMYTDAIFNQDIRIIQTIIGRIDGGLPKDTEVAEYRTLFGDCMNEVLEMTNAQQLMVTPEDTVMMALCKSLFDMSQQDIYHEMKSDDHGNKWSKKVNPSTEKKQARDSALRLVLERSGGRKTAVLSHKPPSDTIKIASWIPRPLPPAEEKKDGQ